MRASRPRSRPRCRPLPPAVVAALLLLTACGDGEGPAGSDVAPGAVGEACAPLSPCEGALVCVDGACRERPWPPDAGPLPELPDATTPDVPDPDAADTDVADPGPDAESDAPDPGPDLPDPDALDADAQDPDVPTDGPADVVTDADVELETIILLIGEDDADEAVGSALVALEPGQAWVTELTLPLAGDLMGMEVILRNVSAPASCGEFLPALWLPDEDGAFVAEPTWTAPPESLQSADQSQAFVFGDTFPVPVGKVRLGLMLVGACEGEDEGPAPALATDASGDLARTFIWVPEAGGAPWVPGSSLGLDGRWALRALTEVPWP